MFLENMFGSNDGILRFLLGQFNGMETAFKERAEFLELCDLAESRCIFLGCRFG